METRARRESSSCLRDFLIVPLTVLLVVASLSTAAPGLAIGSADAAAPTAQPVTGNATANVTATTPPSESDRGRATITLITGDTVRVSERGRTPTYRLTGSASGAVFETDAGTHVVPETVTLSKFDRDLFNVDLLRDQNVTESRGIPVIIEWNGTPSDETIRSLRQTGVRQDRQLEMIDATAATVPKRNATAAYEVLTDAGSVEAVHYDGRVSAAGSPRETVGLRAPGARSNLTGTGIDVAVLDSGINESHPAIGEDEVDEVDFVGDGSVGDAYNHGTPVAGLITGDGTAANGSYAGVAPDANVLDVRVLDGSGTAERSTIIDGIQYAIEQDVDVISMSLGIEATSVRSDDPFHDAVEMAEREGITVVVATGNFDRFSDPTYGSVKSPGILEEVITVGASANDSRISPRSRRGPTPVGNYLKPDLVAPGTGVPAPDGHSDDYQTFNGTSFATPLVSGTAALHAQAHPDWSPDRIKNVVTSTADPVGSANAYQQGAGTLDVAESLDADVVVDPATTDFGRVPTGTTVTRTVTIRNLGTQRKRVAVSATASAIRSSAAGDVSVNRTSVTVPAGGSAAVDLTVDTSDALGSPYSGRIRAGNATAIFGYVPQRPVRVTKRGLGSTTGDSVTLVNTETDTVYGPKTMSDGEATFQIRRPGDFVAVSAGRHRGQPVVTAERATIDGSGHVVLDESETVRRTLDAGSFPHSGARLANRTVVVNATLGTGPVDVRTVAENPSAATVRVSPTSAMTYAVRRVVTVGPEKQAYNTSSVYHLRHVARNVSGPATRSVDVDALDEQRVRYYRGVPGESYRATVGAEAFDDVPLSESYVDGGLGTTFNQTIRVSPSLSQYHDSYTTGPFGLVQWSAKPRQESLSFDSGQRVETAVKKHPFRATAPRWSLSEGQFSATVHPTVGQPPNGYVISDEPPERYDLWVNGDRRRPMIRNAETVDVSADRDGIESVRLRVYDQHGMSPLSNRTVTTFSATTAGDDARPPAVPSVTFGSHGRTNVVPNGSLNVTVATSDAGSSVENVSLYVATRDANGVPETTAFESADGWRRVRLTGDGDGTYTGTVELDDYRGTLSVAARAVDGSGNAVETTATDAVVVGSRAPTARVSANTTLTAPDGPVRFDAGDSYDDLAVASYRWDFDGDGSVDRTTQGPTATHRYEDSGVVRPRLTVVDPHGFENTTRSRPIGVVRALRERIGELDDRTIADVRTAVAAGRVRYAADRLDGRRAVDPRTLFVALGDADGGFEAGAGSTVFVNDGRVNRRAEGHNVVAAAARFNGGIEAGGSVTAVGDSTVARGAIESDESVRVLSDSALAVEGTLETGTLSVGEGGTLTVHGDVEAERFAAENGSAITVRGRLECANADVGEAVAISVRGENECFADADSPGSDDDGERSESAPAQTDRTDEATSVGPDSGDATPATETVR
ncbi:S8 family serine peptidase [Halomicrobium salinisoli]|uniref:S8 family serine peptidase n=1 Tax=Halomicrobium salinisoli TaxID=2878391 RepID=UPI001CF04E10|nr:S8 family serine peptidase [Halomicrobium salinisoli]